MLLFFLAGGLKYRSVWGPVGGGVWGPKMLKNHLCFNDFGDFEGSRSEVVLGGSWGASWGLSGVSGPFWEPLGRLLGASWAVLGAFWAVLRTSWAVVGASWAVLGASRTVLEPLGPSLGRQKPPRGLQDTPRRLRDPPRTPKLNIFLACLHMFIHFQGFRPEMGCKMGSKNGVQKWAEEWGQKWGPKMGSNNGVQHGVQKWDPNRDPKMGSKMGSLIWGGSPNWSLQDSFALTL